MTLLPNNKENGNLAFIKEVAKYFMDFLETDFHKRKAPRRSIQFRNKDNLLLGLNLNRYPSLTSLIWKTINHSFDKSIFNTIEKGVFKTNIPSNLLDLIKQQTKNVSSKQVNELIDKSSEIIASAVTTHKSDYEKALTVCTENISNLIKEAIISPFVNNVKSPLTNSNLGDENTLYLMEEELSAILLSLMDEKIVELLRHLYTGAEIDVSKELKSVVELEQIKNELLSFFENFKIGDLFLELFELERNKSILDKQDFYLYFCDITYNKVKYPIFYIPLNIQKDGDSFCLEFDAQIFVNKKALDFIVQQYNEENDKKGNLKTISERIIYLAQQKDDFKNIINGIIGEITNFFELNSKIDIANSTLQISKGLSVRLSNNCYFCLFDKSDEALVNDYEDILRLLDEENSELAELFNKLIDDFIHKNPQPFNPEIEDEWDSTETSNRLVFKSPIPLNSEQLQILSAIKKKDCRYVIVEGPPGTGKSHTITAIVFDSILKNNSVLVLSDKKEALDVVEDKITETMNKVRHDKNFQNPILRLGKTGNTYNQILATSSIENIKLHYRAVKKDYELLEDSIDKTTSSLLEDLEAEILAYGDIDLIEVAEFFNLDKYYKTAECPVDVNEALSKSESSVEFEEYRNIFKSINAIFAPDNKDNVALNILRIGKECISSLSDLQLFVTFISKLLAKIKDIKEIWGDKISSLDKIKSIKDADYEKLTNIIRKHDELKNKYLGYLFKGKALARLSSDCKDEFPYSSITNVHLEINILKSALAILKLATEARGDLKCKYLDNTNYLELIYSALTNDNIILEFQEISKLGKDVQYIQQGVKEYPLTFKKIGFSSDDFVTCYDNGLLKISDLEFEKIIRYLTLGLKVQSDFTKIPQLNYPGHKKQIEDLVTAQMTYLLDGRLIDFFENNRATARALRDIIRSKRRFPKDEFARLKEAFPCILAGIRDYAEYIPLEPEIFDLVIIDEASQVSIAQAFPALLRAKKILILGDKKQFSNVKSAQARTDTNREYLNNLDHSFKKNVSDDQTKLVKLSKFNIKTSILEFFEYISNYNSQLLKHFRGYKEIISYSNKFFYQDNLQVMKIRGKPIDDVLKFSFIEHKRVEELFQNTNTQEVEFIISELHKIKETGNTPSIGIITPHTNQQKLIAEMVSKLPECDHYYNKNKLKIMTFDTCQGEERDIIFYSMVATKNDDKLWGVFIKDLKDVDIEEEGKIKAQRLNVGFSRCKECMRFVLSKPIDEYRGSVGEALRHYYFVLNETKKERNVSEVDSKSKMEPEVMNWFYQTDFWRKNKDSIDFRPQFELGKYLKQLDRTYNHPNYKVDFLLIYKDENNNEYKIIIEYDGFQSHFKDDDVINQYNYREYYSDEDVYREKVLESYGYKFLRINKFNIGNNPISTLDKRLSKLIKYIPADNEFIAGIRDTVDGLQNGDMKECPKCKEIRNLSDFRDTSRVSGYGRFCKQCKKTTSRKRSKSKARPQTQQYAVAGSRLCPKCGASMVLRSGRYGRFYGCSKFPYCRGTRQYN